MTPRAKIHGNDDGENRDGLVYEDGVWVNEDGETEAGSVDDPATWAGLSPKDPAKLIARFGRVATGWLSQPGPNPALDAQLREELRALSGCLDQPPEVLVYVWRAVRAGWVAGHRYAAPNEAGWRNVSHHLEVVRPDAERGRKMVEDARRGGLASPRKGPGAAELKKRIWELHALRPNESVPQARRRLAGELELSERTIRRRTPDVTW